MKEKDPKSELWLGSPYSGFTKVFTGALLVLCVRGKERPHYNVNMTGVKVGNYSLRLPSNLYELGGKKGAIIDIGTTLAYLPEIVYEPLVIQILSRQPHLKLVTVQDLYTCFKYAERYNF
ncbi:Aspartic proteinase-like protein 2 [Bienertia sinuspersici]